LCIAGIALALSFFGGCAQSHVSTTNEQPGHILPAAAKYPVIVERDATMETRDGIKLRSDIYHPDNTGRFPVLLQRSPYNKLNSVGPALRAAECGYVVVVQDVRGRYASEGEWYPFVHESEDGYDAVEWASALPYSDGRVGMYGGSYLGATVMLAAIAHPPHLAGIFTHLTPSNFYKQWVYQGGAFEQWFNDSWLWSTAIGSETVDRAYQPGDNPLLWRWRLPVTSHYPQFDFGSAIASTRFYLDWARHSSYDDYWKKVAVDEHYDQITVPIFHIAGWYDTFLHSTLDNYEGITTHGPESSHASQRLVIGPWLHGPLTGKTGDIDFGPTAALDYDALMIRWFDHLLKGVDNGIEREKPVKFFVMGRNVWREEDEWPPQGSLQAFYLHAAGRANSANGVGTLDMNSPVREIPDHYVYDPMHPVPTLGGGLCCDTRAPAGAFDQRTIESRSDVLVYTTSPFGSDFEVTGPVRLDLYASSSAPDTDFTAKLVDVWPNGYAQNLVDGIIRARFRLSFSSPAPLHPGAVAKFSIDLGATSNVFLKGHRLRLEISSSNFPRFDRNLNTGKSPELSSGSAVALNSVFHDAQHPSALTLYVGSKN